MYYDIDLLNVCSNSRAVACRIPSTFSYLCLAVWRWHLIARLFNRPVGAYRGTGNDTIQIVLADRSVGHAL